MPTILCFGDSNTWGYDPMATARATVPQRYPAIVRWTGILATTLGPEWTIISEGQNGRTTVHDDPTVLPPRNGRDYLPACLESHQPIDVVVIMLGTNDLKSMFHLPAQDIAAGVGVLAQIVLKSTSGANGSPPQVLIVTPPPVGDLQHLPDLEIRFEQGRTRSLQFPRFYEEIANKLGVAFLNVQQQLSPSPLDGLHLTAAAHAALGTAVAAKLQTML